jgi:hypothetical protein
MNYLHTVGLGHPNPCLAFIHHGGGAGGFLLLAMIALAVLAVALIATTDKSK